MYITLFFKSERASYSPSIYLRNVAKDEVSIKYNSDKDSVTYFVYHKMKNGFDYHTLFTVTNQLEIVDGHGNEVDFEYDDDVITALLLAAKEEEKALKNDKENFTKIFENPSPKLEKYLNSNSLDDVLQIEKNRTRFLSVLEERFKNKETFLNTNETVHQGKCDIELSIQETYNDVFSVNIRVGDSKKYVVKNLDEFICSYDLKETHRFSKKFILKLCPESFTDRANKIIELLRNRCHDHLYMGFVYEADAVAKMIELFNGETIGFEEVYHKVAPNTIDTSVYIDETGGLSFEPHYNREDTNLFFYNKKGFLVNYEKYTIQVLNFESRAKAELYNLGYEINYKMEDVIDLMNNDFSTFVRKAVKTKIKNKENCDLKIKLYISLDLQKSVVFKTIYSYKDEEVEKETISSDQLLNNLLVEYQIRLEELGFLENGKSKDMETLDKIITSDYSSLKEIADVYLSDDIANLKKSKLQNLIIKASSGKDWLTLQVSSSQYSRDELKQILSAYKKKKKFVLLKNDFITLDNKETLDDLKELDDNFSLDENLENYEVPIYQIFKLANYESKENYEVDYDDKIREIIKSIKNFKNKEISLNEYLATILRSYQIDAIKWMKTLYDNSLSGILADDMGLGKSIEFISFRTLVKENAPTLIVCPKSLIYNWKGEFKKRDKSTMCHLIDGTKTQRLATLNRAKSSNDVIIVSYDSLRSDLEEFKKIHFSIVCLDEAQYIKNSFTQKSKAVKQLDATSRFALTGTPIENALTDLWSIFDFLMPKYLSSEDNFSREYVDAFNNSDENSKKRLLAKITPFILRRTKDDVLTDLPPKTTEVINLVMSKKQSELYNAYVLNTKNSIEDNPKNKLAVLSALTRLRQICVDPSSFLENFTEVSPKLEYALNLAQKAISSDHKVLIFSQFTTILEHLQELLNKEKIKWLYICGDTKAQERINIASTFNESKDVNVILVSLKAGGTGLNLHGADTVLHLDPWWNFAVEDQATDRAHRIGQTRPVTVYKLVAHDSIEERVLELQESKKDLYEQVITNGSQNITNITDEDIKFLLS